MRLLEREVASIAADAELEAAAVAVHDFATGHAWDVNGDRWFHAASTIKVAILVALASAVGEHRFELYSRLAVRNRFLSAAD
ncbi:class A beta-lactamase-related serine hydrolase, partial [Klebsiella pneumoniae]|nr:class A beta-lactamase-related serine hydrolase [Klebsiella pneumoniae]